MGKKETRYFAQFCKISSNAKKLFAVFTLAFIFISTGIRDETSDSQERLDSLYAIIENEVSSDHEIIDAYIYLADFYNPADTAKTSEYLNKAIELASKTSYYKGLADAYNKFCDHNVDVGSYEKAIRYGEKALLAAKKNDYKKGQALSLNLLGKANNHQSKYSEALIFLTQSKEIFEHIGDKRGLTLCLTNIGKNYYYQSNYDLALEYYERSLKLSIELNDVAGEAFCYHIIGQVYGNQGDYPSALDNYFKSLKRFEEIGDKREIGATFSKIALIYGYHDDYKTSLEYSLKAVEIAKELDDKKGLSRSYGITGSIYMHQLNFTKAKEYIFKSLEIRKAIDNKHGISISYNNLGDVYMRELEYDQALEYYQKSLAISTAIGNGRGVIYSLEGIGQIYSKIGDHSQALNYLSRAKQASTEEGMLALTAEISQKIIETYENSNDIAAAYKSYKEYVQIKDSLFNYEKGLAIGRIESANELNQRKKENELLIQQNEMIQKEKAFAEFRSKVYIAIAVFLFVFLIVIYSLQRSRQRAKNLLIEHEKKLQEVKSDLFLNIAHELRTPLTLMYGPLRVLESDEHLSEKQRKSFERIRQNSQKLVTLANEILLTSQLENEKLTPVYNPIKLKKSLFKIWASFEVEARNKSMEYTHIDRIEKEVVSEMDISMLDKIISVLISNALKYCHKGDAITFKSSVQHNQLVLEVNDTGPGIPKEDQEHIFERYYQSANSTQTESVGVGIGLALAKDMVEALNGVIIVSSGDAGTDFKVNIPLKWPEDQTPFSEDDKALKERDKIVIEKDLPQIQNTEDITILIIEDHLDMLQYLKDILEGKNYNVISAKNGEEGMRQLLKAKKKVDLIISDIKMPVMDGFEFLEQVQQDKELARIPVILLTSLTNEVHRIKAYSIGVTEFINKPFHRYDLLSACAKVINKQNKVSDKYAT